MLAFSSTFCYCENSENVWGKEKGFKYCVNDWILFLIQDKILFLIQDRILFLIQDGIWRNI